MNNQWTFGRIIAAGFAAGLLLIVIAGGIGLVGVRSWWPARTG